MLDGASRANSRRSAPATRCCAPCGSSSARPKGSGKGACSDAPQALEGSWPQSPERFGFSFDPTFHRRLARKGIGPLLRSEPRCPDCYCGEASQPSRGGGRCGECDIRSSEGSTSPIGRKYPVALEGTWPASDEPLGFAFDPKYHASLAAKGLVLGRASSLKARRPPAEAVESQSEPGVEIAVAPRRKSLFPAVQGPPRTTSGSSKARRLGTSKSGTEPPPLSSQRRTAKRRTGAAVPIAGVASFADAANQNAGEANAFASSGAAASLQGFFSAPNEINARAGGVIAAIESANPLLESGYSSQSNAGSASVFDTRLTSRAGIANGLLSSRAEGPSSSTLPGKLNVRDLNNGIAGFQKGSEAVGGLTARGYTNAPGNGSWGSQLADELQNLAAQGLTVQKKPNSPFYDPTANVATPIINGVFGMYQERMTLSAIIDPDLLQYVVWYARRFEGSPAADIWHAAWEEREDLGPLDQVTPPNSRLLIALIHFARIRSSDRAQDILKAASEATLVTTPDSQISLGLAKPVVDIARRDEFLSMGEVYWEAWGLRRFSFGGNVIDGAPERELVGLLIRAARDDRDQTWQAALNNALGSLLYRRLGGVELELVAVDGLVEAALLDSIITLAAAHPEIRDFPDRAYDATQELWPLIAAHRAERWDLPWPPSPTPDFALLAMLIQVAVWDPTRLLANDLLLALATVPLQRSTEEHLGRIRQAATGEGEDEPGVQRDEASEPLGVGEVGGSAALVVVLGGFVCGIGEHYDGFEDKPVGRLCAEAREWPVFGEALGALADAVYGIGWMISHRSLIWDLITGLFESEPIEEEKPKPPIKGPPLTAPMQPDGPDDPIPENDSEAEGATAQPTTPEGNKPQRIDKLKPRDISDLAKSTLASPPPWDDKEFIQRLCNDAQPMLARFGFGVPEFLVVLINETTGGMMSPSSANLGSDGKIDENTAIGINQMTIANIRFYEPSLAALGLRELYDTYREYSRSEQMDPVLAFFKAVLYGFDPHALGNYTVSQRAAVVHYRNAGGTVHSVAEFNSAAKQGVFHRDWLLYNNNNNVGLTYYRRPLMLTKEGMKQWDKNARVNLGDLEWHARNALRNGIMQNMTNSLKSCGVTPPPPL